jgi:hypothetical protein
MKFHIRNADGELVVSSYAELRSLYQRQFISDDDEVRRDDSDRWVKAGDMPDLRAARPPKYWKGNEFVWLAVAIAIGTLLMILLMKR